MLPKITKNKFSSGYDKSQYFGELLDDYININKSTNEPITEYNTTCINLINSAVDNKLNPLIMKLAIIGRLASKAEDYGTNRNCYQIIKSLQKQRNYYRLCRDTLERAAINKNYYIIIKYNLNKGVVNRCERLDESLLPNLIEESRLNVYVDYLADRNTTLEKDFKKYYDYDFKAFSKDFKTCFAKLGANYRYFEPRIEDARNLAINCLDFLSAIRSEGFSTQNAFKEFPILEKYYKRCSLSNLEIFMNVISSGTADIKTFYTVLAKVKRELSKTD